MRHGDVDDERRLRADLGDRVGAATRAGLLARRSFPQFARRIPASASSPRPTGTSSGRCNSRASTSATTSGSTTASSHGDAGAGPGPPVARTASTSSGWSGSSRTTTSRGPPPCSTGVGQRAAAVATLTQTGARLVHDGQLDGRTVRLPVFLGRYPDEPVDRELSGFYDTLLAAVKDSTFRTGTWELCDCTGWPGNDTSGNLVAWCWDGDSRWLVVVNLSDADASGHVRTAWNDLPGETVTLTDPTTNAVFERTGYDLVNGLYVELGPGAGTYSVSVQENAVGAERERVDGSGAPSAEGVEAGDWYLWGPYLSERQWGTVREDYSADGDAWDYLPARPRPLPGLPLGRGRPGRLLRRRAAAVPRPGAVERARPDPQGADVRADRRPRATTARTSRSTGGTSTPLPSHAWNRWRYHYPQAAFPYDDLVAENGRRGQHEPEYELLDTGVVRRRPLLDRRGRLRQGRPDRPADDGPRHQRRARTPTTLHVLPTLWFRNTWSWDATAPSRPARARPATATRRRRPPARSATSSWSPARARTAPRPSSLFCDNETNAATPLRRAPPTTPYPKDGINDHVVHGRGHGQPRPARHQGARSGTSSTVGAGRDASSCGCGCGRHGGRRAGRGRPRWAPTFDAGRRRARGPRPTSSTPS